MQKQTVIFEENPKWRIYNRDVPDTTLPDTGFNRIVIYRIPDSSKFKHKS